MKKITSILLVDDDVDDQEIFSEALSIIDNSIRLNFALNGQDALKLLQSEQKLPDVIFSDINMPLMNGIQMLEEIKKLSHLRNIPVIMYTTSSSNSNQLQSQLLGIQHYIIKPSCFEKICSEIKTGLEKIKTLTRKNVYALPFLNG